MAYSVTVPCDCCALPAGCGTLQCRSRGGTATICGISEFTSPSVPPKKYRKWKVSGTRWICSYSNNTCLSTSIAQVLRDEMNDSHRDYAKSNCSVTAAGLARRYGIETTNPAQCPYGGSTTTGGPFDPTAGSAPSILPGAGGMTVSMSPTLSTATGTNICFGDSFFAGNKVTGTITDTLSDEDTEDDAINRLLTPGTWGAWITAGASGCTGVPPACCLAAYQSRTTGFSFSYVETEWRMNYSGLTPGQYYTATVSAWRRPFGSGSYALYQSITVGGAADGSGNLVLTGTTPNEKGFQTYVTCP